MAAVQSSANLTYAELETSTSSPKELSAIFRNSKVPIQRLICARNLTIDNDDDPLSTALNLSKDVERTVREAIARTLGNSVFASEERRVEKIIPILLSLARDSATEVRSSAAVSLAIVPHRNRVVSWLTLCRDKDPKIRVTGAECLGATAQESSKVSNELFFSFILPELLSLAREDLNYSVRKAACKAWRSVCEGCSRWPNATRVKTIASECILFSLSDPAWPVRRAAMEAVPFVCGGDKRYDNAIASVLLHMIDEDSSAWVKNAGKRCLGAFLANSKIDSTELIVAYVNLGKSEDEEMRFACAFFLPGVIQGSSAVDAYWNSYFRDIHTALCGDASGRIRRTLAHSLHVVAKCIGPLAAASHLSPVFSSFIQDMDDEDEIRLGAIKGCSSFIGCLPSSARKEAMNLIDVVLKDISTPPLASLAVSRDARLSLAQQLPALGKITPPVPGLGKIFLQLATDEAHQIREKALDVFGEIAASLDSWDSILKEFEQLACSQHFWARWAFARGVSSLSTSDKSKHLCVPLTDKLKILQTDPVLAVRTAAGAAATTIPL